MCYDVPRPHPAGHARRSGLNIATVKIQSLETRFQWRERMRWCGLEPPATSASSGNVGGGPPTNVVKSPDAHPADLDSLRAQQLTLQLQVAAVAAECTASTNNAMARRRGITAAMHDVTDRAPCPRTAGELCNVAVRRNLSAGNPPDRREHPPPKRAYHLPTITFPRIVNPPRLDSWNSRATLLGLAPRASGTVAHSASNAAPIHRPR